MSQATQDQLSFKFGKTVAQFTVTAVTDSGATNIEVKRIKPAVRGPLMVTIGTKTRSIYDWVWLSQGNKLAKNQRAVPVSRDYTEIPGKMEIRTQHQLDIEYRSTKVGRPSKIDLETLLDIHGQLATKTTDDVAANRKMSPTSITQINTGETYWYTK